MVTFVVSSSAQCELVERLKAGLPQMEHDYPRRKALKSRAQELHAAYGDDWNEPFRQAGCRKWTYFRGFVDEVVISGESFLRSADTIFETGPVQLIHLVEPIGDLAKLGSIEQLTRLPELSLFGCWIGNKGARTLANLPNLRNLKVLVLSYNNIGDQGARDLASSPNLNQLTKVYLNRPHFGDPTGKDAVHDDVASTLASSPHLQRLTFLDLDGNLIGATGRQALQARFDSVHETDDCETNTGGFSVWHEERSPTAVIKVSHNP